MNTNEPKKPGRPKGLPKTGGRVKGQLPLLGKSVRETLQNILGMDDEAVARTGKINGKGVSARRRLWETLHGLRPVTAMEFLAYLKFCHDYGIGTPIKMQTAATEHRSLAFITPRGLVWELDPLAKQESALLKAQAENEILQAQTRAAIAQATATPASGRPAAKVAAEIEAEELELVCEPVDRR